MATIIDAGARCRGSIGFSHIALFTPPAGLWILPMIPLPGGLKVGLAPNRNSWSRLCPVLISDHSPFTWSRPRSQELPEAPTSLDLAEDRLHRGHAQGVALTTPFGPQLPTHPVPGGQLIGDAALGGRWQYSAVAGFLRRDERIRAQRVEIVNCLGPVVASVGGYFPRDHTGVADGPPPWPPPAAGPRSGWWPERCHNHLVRAVHHPLTVVGLDEIPTPGAGMMWESASVKLRCALSSGAPGCSRPSAAACSAAAWASSAATASRIFCSRPSRKANSSGNSSPRRSVPYCQSSSSSTSWARRSNSTTSAANCASLRTALRTALRTSATATN